MIRMILAVDQNNAIGNNDGSLPWHLPTDLKRFKTLTAGSTVVMGRKTFESFGKPNGLPNRKNVVISQTLRESPGPDVEIFTGSASEYCERHLATPGAADIWIIGGATVFDAVLHDGLVDEIYLTRVDVESDADVGVTFDLFNYEGFILGEAFDGVSWAAVPEEPIVENGIQFQYVWLYKLGRE